MYILSVDSLVHIAILFLNVYEIVKHILFQDLWDYVLYLPVCFIRSLTSLNS